MKLFLSIFCICAAQVGWAQDVPAPSRVAAGAGPPALIIQFKSVGPPLAISPGDMFLGYPLCSANGTTFLNVRLSPNYAEQSLIGVSPKGELTRYAIGSAPGLVHVNVVSVDASSSDVDVLVSAQKLDILRDHGIDPDSPEARTDSASYHFFILRFDSDHAAPDETVLTLPFDPIKLAVISKDAFMILGFDRVNNTPIVAFVDNSGQLVREVDTYNSVGNVDSLVANAPQGIASQMQGSGRTAQAEMLLSTAQLVHYGDALLLLIPGSSARVTVVRSNGDIQSTTLHLPKGFVAESLVSSDRNWVVRVSDGSQNGPGLLAVFDPASGDVLRVIRNSQLSANDITCVHDGNYFAIHGAPDGKQLKLFLMSGSE